jgi:hypothetical protein
VSGCVSSCCGWDRKDFHAFNDFDLLDVVLFTQPRVHTSQRAALLDVGGGQAEGTDEK